MAASAAVVCLATLTWVVAGGGAPGGDRPPGGYVVVGGSDPSGSASAEAGPSNGRVTLAPAPSSSRTGDSTDSAGMAPAPYRPAGGATARGGPPAGSGRRARPPRPRPSVSTSASASDRPSVSASVPASARPSARATASPSPSVTAVSPTSRLLAPVPAPDGPPALTVSAPVDAPGARPWCQEVTVTYRNAGPAAVDQGRTVFTTRVVDVFGLAWGAYRSTFALPAPIPPGGAVTRTYTVCLAPWQVPPGLRMRTADVTLVA